MDIFKRIAKTDDIVIDLVKDQIENKIDAGNLDIVMEILSFVYGILKKRYEVSPVIVVVKLITLLIDIAGDDLNSNDAATITNNVSEYIGDHLVDQIEEDYKGNE